MWYYPAIVIVKWLNWNNTYIVDYDGDFFFFSLIIYTTKQCTKFFHCKPTKKSSSTSQNYAIFRGEKMCWLCSSIASRWMKLVVGAFFRTRRQHTALIQNGVYIKLCVRETQRGSSFRKKKTLFFSVYNTLAEIDWRNSRKREREGQRGERDGKWKKDEQSHDEIHFGM